MDVLCTVFTNLVSLECAKGLLSFGSAAQAKFR